MTREEFLTLVETYGADLTRWPDQSQAGALKLIDEGPDFADPLLAQARDLDDALNTARVTLGTDMLKARILSAAKISADTLPAAVNAKPAGLRYRAAAAMMAVSFVLGFAGANFMNAGETDSELTLTASNEWEEVADDYGMSDLYEWVAPDALP